MTHKPDFMDAIPAVTPNLLQMLSIEIGERCNLGQVHAACPNHLGRRRYADLRTDKLLDDATIYDVVQRFYRAFGFRGLVAWHYYCEPLVESERMFRLMGELRRLVPESRFLLWTNGMLIPSDCRPFSVFEKIHITNYGGGFAPRNLDHLRDVCSQVEVQQAHLDARLDCAEAKSDQPCVRPFTEFVIDIFGNVHLCCIDWRGQASPGNILVDGLDTCVRRWAEMVRTIGGNRLMEIAPDACRRCGMRYGTMSRFDLSASLAAEAWRSSVRSIQADYQPPQPLTPPPAAPADCTQDRRRVPHWGELTSQYRMRIVQHVERPPIAAGPVRLMAVVGTWHEADVIEATVRNLFVQGVDEVLIVDNDSPDDTCRVAEQAGAKIADVFHTDYYLEAVRLFRINRVIVEASRPFAGQDLWWMAIDADELPQGPRGMTIREYLATCGGAYNAVSAIAFDHYPSGEPANVPGRHPADYQPYGMLRASVGTHVGFWKHPLLFYPAGVGWPYCFSRGMHVPSSMTSQPIVAPPDPILIHHVPFREKAATLARLKALCAAPVARGGYRSMADDHDIQNQGATKRYRTFEAIYSQQWDGLDVAHSQGHGKIEIKHWSTYFTAEQYEPRRWY